MNSAESLEPQRGCRGGRWLDRAGAQRGSLDCRHTQLPKPWARGRPLTDLYVQKKEKRVQGMGPGGPRLKGYAEKNGSGSKETVSGKVGVISGERERERVVTEDKRGGPLGTKLHTLVFPFSLFKVSI